MLTLVLSVPRLNMHADDEQHFPWVIREFSRAIVTHDKIMKCVFLICISFIICLDPFWSGETKVCRWSCAVECFLRPSRTGMNRSEGRCRFVWSHESRSFLCSNAIHVTIEERDKLINFPLYLTDKLGHSVWVKIDLWDIRWWLLQRTSTSTSMKSMRSWNVSSVNNHWLHLSVW